MGEEPLEEPKITVVTWDDGDEQFDPEWFHSHDISRQAILIDGEYEPIYLWMNPNNMGYELLDEYGWNQIDEYTPRWYTLDEQMAKITANAAEVRVIYPKNTLVWKI
jgi:hypothetical protein